MISVIAFVRLQRYGNCVAIGLQRRYGVEIKHAPGPTESRRMLEMRYDIYL